MSIAPNATRGAPIRPHEASFTSCPIGTSTTLHGVAGEIDAANASDLSDYVDANLEDAGKLILDLRELTFFGTQGFSVLHRINVTCSRRGVTLVVVSGSEVDRILRICDPAGGLPVARSLEAAINAAASPPPTHLRLVPRG
ncbi:STAS domain-containing protein [Mycolicibacterium lacusdiani]|uniref:STAS domain-containing protein n=1 Tax=Mycolicibacterium lacusdiani TaxID=2895283 RepID=UPI001F421FD4|nr:STAS domain-containing protein [Mycolicibacterium lacusdiani]